MPLIIVPTSFSAVKGFSGSSFSLLLLLRSSLLLRRSSLLLRSPFDVADATCYRAILLHHVSFFSPSAACCKFAEIGGFFCPRISVSLQAACRNFADSLSSSAASLGCFAR